jgi:hypothetical protein
MPFHRTRLLSRWLLLAAIPAQSWLLTFEATKRATVAAREDLSAGRECEDLGIVRTAVDPGVRDQTALRWGACPGVASHVTKFPHLASSADVDTG